MSRKNLVRNPELWSSRERTRLQWDKTSKFYRNKNIL